MNPVDRGTARAAIEALYAAYNAHDPDSVALLYTPSGVHEEVADGRCSVGREEIAGGLTRLFAAFPDAEWSPETVVIEGSQGVVSYRLSGTLQGPLGPVPPLGQKLDLRGVHVVELDDDGKIERSLDYWDAATFRGQMEVAAEEQQVAQTCDADDFRHAMRLLAGGVVVVTTEVDGRPWGLTVSACCSLTAEPPRILISLDSRTVSARSILERGGFGVAVLGADQVSAARVCSSQGEPKFIEAFTDDAAAVRSDSPVIRDSLVHLDCAVERSYPVGDHRMIVGLVREAIVSQPDHRPLVYFERTFRGIGTPIG